MSRHEKGEVLLADHRLLKYIATRDARIAKAQPWSPTPLLDEFKKLCAGQAIRVGGRATCGSYVDPTWKVFCAWREVIAKARKLGYEIHEKNIKHGNRWATKAGGFWDEYEYSLGEQSHAEAA